MINTIARSTDLRIIVGTITGVIAIAAAWVAVQSLLGRYRKIDPRSETAFAVWLFCWFIALVAMLISISCLAPLTNPTYWN